MPASPTDTIFAVSSGAAPAAIAVLRISGEDAISAAAGMANQLPPPRRAGLRRLHDAAGNTLDHALILIFPAPNTATGEDLVEFHLHGGRAIVAAVEAELATKPGLRRAEPGEFTRRALGAGRIDLAQAEGLADLLAAETETQRRVALSAAEGALGQKLHSWTQTLLMLSARAEAQIDFADEDDVAADERAVSDLRHDVGLLAAELDDVLAQPPVERIRDGLRVVLAGPPNSGKSSLLNALAERPVSIATPIAGTTRDRIEAPVMRDGAAYILIDTAGLVDETNDPVEAIGVGLAKSAINEADILLWLGDDPGPQGAVALHPRADLPDRAAVPASKISVSVTTGAGISEVWLAIARRSAILLPRVDRLLLNERQRTHVAQASMALARAHQCADPMLIAEELRLARLSFDAVTGVVHTEQMLDALFGRFCIGK
ncbi:MAG TPA: tRNA uridine-5-carboxymethylaminomethyl(34) synthesis GTPase MnmE [Sphingomicrobium sp.]